MTADERLDRIRIKVKRAKEQISDLNLALDSFKKSNPYTVGTKRKPETRELVYYIVSMKEMPPAIPLITGDIIHNVRSALDHLAYQLFLLGPDGKDKKLGSQIYFPVFDSSEKYETGVGAKTKGIPEKAMKAISRIEPYKGGKGHLLWCLHQLDITDKHRLLVTVQTKYRSVNVGPPFKRGDASLRAQWEASGAKERGFPPPEMPVFDLFVGAKDAKDKVTLQIGTELFGDAPDSEPDDKIQFLFEISLNEPQIAESQPLTEFLQQMIDFVDNLISSFRPFLG